MVKGFAGPKRETSRWERNKQVGGERKMNEERQATTRAGTARRTERGARKSRHKRQKRETERAL